MLVYNQTSAMIIGNGSYVVENNFVSICTMIAPRLEISFLEEWIEHHLMIGFDKIYIYNTGFILNANEPRRGQRKLCNEEVGVKWSKKPNAEYNLHLSDEEIHLEMLRIVERYRKNVKLIEWYWRDDFSGSVHTAQCKSYEHCVSNFKSDWWLNIDPDEYVVVKSHENIKEFLKQDIRVGNHKRKKVTSFWLGQRVFEKRVNGTAVKKIFNWGYDLPNHCKCLVKNPISSFVSPIHKARNSGGRPQTLSMEDVLIHHYRGHPNECASVSHATFLKDHPDMNFNNIDKSMKRFLK